MLAVADIKPLVFKLPAEMLPALTLATVVLPLTLSVPVALINPLVKMLPPETLAVDTMLPLVLTMPVI
jgi:hypothetical protein